MQFSLRGGGCGASKQIQRSVRSPRIPTIIKMPQDFNSRIKGQIDIMKEGSDKKIEDALQHLMFQEQLFAMLLDKENEPHDYVESFQEFMHDLLNIAENFARSNGPCCSMAVQICAWLAKVIFWFYSNNFNRRIKVEDQHMYLEKIQSIEDKIDHNLNESEIAYEILVVKVIMRIIPNNDKEYQDVLTLFCQGIFESISYMQVSETLSSALKQGGKMALDEAQKAYLRNQYNQIFQIEKLKWAIIQNIQFDNRSISLLVSDLGGLYEKIKSSSWYVNYCWIKSVTSIICMKPLIYFQSLTFDYHIIDQLRKSQTIIQVDQEMVLINLNYKKLYNKNEQELHNKIPVFTRIAQIQEKLINGQLTLPSFERYAKLNHSRQQEGVSPFMYFKEKLDQINLTQIIVNINQISKLIPNESIRKVIFFEKLVQHNQFVDGLTQAMEQIQLYLEKMNQINNQFSQLQFIQQQWEKLTSEQLELQKINEYQLTKLQLSQLNMMKLDENYFKKEYIRICPQEETLEVVQQKFRRLQTKTITNFSEFYPIMQFRLRQINGLMLINQENIKYLKYAKVLIEYLVDLALNLKPLEIANLYKKKQDILKSYFASLKEIPTDPLKEIGDLSDQLESYKEQKSTFKIPSDSVDRLYQIIQYEHRKLDELVIAHNHILEIYRHFMDKQIESTIGIQVIQNTVSEFKGSIKQAQITLAQQAEQRQKILQFLRGIVFRIPYQRFSVQDIKEVIKNVPQMMNQKSYSLDTILANCLSLVNEKRAYILKQQYEFEVTNSPDTESQTLLEQDLQLIDYIERSILMIQELEDAKSQDYKLFMTKVIDKLMSHLNVDDSQNKEISEIGIKNKDHQELCRRYEKQFIDLTQCIETAADQIFQIDKYVTLMTFIKDIGSSISQDWIKDTQVKLHEVYKMLDSIKLKQLNIDYSQPFKAKSQIYEQIFPSDYAINAREMINHYMNRDELRIKECLALQLIKIRQNCLKQNFKTQVDMILLRMRTFETDKKLKSILHNFVTRQAEDFRDLFLY